MVTARGQDVVKKNWNFSSPFCHIQLNTGSFLISTSTVKRHGFPTKSMEKLKAVCEQEESKDKFLQQMRTFTLGTSQKA